MTYAVVKDRGRQLRVELSQTARLDLLAGKRAGDAIVFEAVVLAASGKSVAVGRPLLEGAKVLGRVMGQEKGEKIRHLRCIMMNSKRSLRGGRPWYTRVRIEAISVPGLVEATAAPWSPPETPPALPAESVSEAVPRAEG